MWQRHQDRSEARTIPRTIWSVCLEFNSSGLKTVLICCLQVTAFVIAPQTCEIDEIRKQLESIAFVDPEYVNVHYVTDPSVRDKNAFKALKSQWNKQFNVRIALTSVIFSSGDDEDSSESDDDETASVDSGTSTSDSRARRAIEIKGVTEESVCKAKKAIEEYVSELDAEKTVRSS